MIKHFSSIMFISLITITIGLADTSEKYALKKINSSINSTWLIGNYKMSSKMKCFAQCNFMTNCYSVAYRMDSASIYNCACYSKEFATNDSIVMQNSYLYSKQQNMQNVQQQQCRTNNSLNSFFGKKINSFLKRKYLGTLRRTLNDSICRIKRKLYLIHSSFFYYVFNLIVHLIL